MNRSTKAQQNKTKRQPHHGDSKQINDSQNTGTELNDFLN